MDQSLDAGFRPGMGSVLPDRFFWAQPPAAETEADAGAEAVAPEAEPADAKGKGVQRRVH
jgi:hydroxymethylpyrimidine/phosphomethylpyrimidine kinase